MNFCLGLNFDIEKNHVSHHANWVFQKTVLNFSRIFIMTSTIFYQMDANLRTFTYLNKILYKN